jgi:2-succinyl-5-enolpyruvyl-6-hydroxy-3-cyclohexene-1-carboxylate synthase
MTPTDTHVLLRAFADELTRCGVTDACTSPGSRCAPLVLALVRERRLRCWSHLDERSAGFFALGLAKASGRPVALTCTSGTAAANFGPAVIEAHEARVPLIVLTADRPPELRDSGAGQTIDQIKLYGTAAKWFVEVGDHEATPERLRWMRRLACRAVWTAQDGRPGPVHLNFGLREPLVPDLPLPEDPVPGRAGGAPWVARAPARSAGPERELPGPGVVVAGRDERGDPPALAAWAAAAGWPLLADPLSGARRGAAAVAHYDALLRVQSWAEGQRPACVLRAGDLPTSKPLRAWLASLECPQVILDPEAAWQDPNAVANELHPGPLAALRVAPADPAWLGRWRAADAAAARAVAAALGDALSEPRVAAELGATLGADEILWVASSMPVRDVETFFPARDHPPRVLSNRGANGIDGTPSSAFGAAASGVPVTLLTGDVALLHDLGGLIAHRRLGLDLRIVLLNNDGGGIFHFLPVAAQRDAFEEHVATPHGTDFAQAAELFDLPYARAESLADLRRAGIVEVRTDREENVGRHRCVWAEVAGALSG